MRLSSLLLVTVSCFGLEGWTTADAKPVPYNHIAKRRPPAEATPARRVADANAAALQEPRADSFMNATQIYPFSDGAIYRLYASPEKVSDIALQAGEQLIAISAGDTARWVIGDTYSGTDAAKQVHVLVKPYTAGLKTNLVITTSKRTYHVQMESTPVTAMTVISWSYPQDTLLAMQAAQARAEAARPVDRDISISNLQFRYAVTGDKPSWRPVNVFDDGEKVYIQFPPSLAQGEAPPLFIVGPDGQAELLNYRLEKGTYIVDRLFSVAELRLGGKRQSIVRISRTDLKARQTVAGPQIGGGHD